MRTALVGVLGINLLTSSLLKQTAGTVGDLLAGAGVHVVTGLLGNSIKGLVAVVVVLAGGGVGSAQAAGVVAEGRATGNGGASGFIEVVHVDGCVIDLCFLFPSRVSVVYRYMHCPTETKTDRPEDQANTVSKVGVLLISPVGTYERHANALKQKSSA